MNRSSITLASVFVAALLSVGVAPSLATSSDSSDSQARNVAIVVWDGAEVLDWAGPAEVFAAAGHFGRSKGVSAFEVYTVSKSTDPIISQGFVSVNPQYSIEDAPTPDIVVLPGGGTSSVLRDPAFFAWASKVATEAEVVLSVCTGAFILGEAGLLDGKEVTTWFDATDRLEEQFPAATVIRGKRFVDQGNVLTTAGISAGIDGSLHLVARLLGRAVANETAEYMEYRWTPESYLAKSYSILNPSLDSRGQTLQRADLDAKAGVFGAAIATYEALLEEDPSDANLWMKLGMAYYRSERFEPAGQAFVKASEDEGLRPNAAYGSACNFALAGLPDRAFEQLDRALAAGFENRELLENDSDLDSLREDVRFDVVLGRLE